MNPALPLPLPSVPPAELESRLTQTQRWETLGILASGAVRDFNHLLDAITGHAASAERLLPDEHPAQAELTRIRSAAHHAAELVGRVLQLSQPDVGPSTIVNVADLIQQALPLLRASLPGAVEVRSGLDLQAAFVSVEPNDLLQVFFSLGTNAGQAIAGTGTVAVTLTRATKDEAVGVAVGELGPGGYICLSVSDTGDGIDPSVRSRIFEPFFTTKDCPFGTGLGLAAVRSIVLRHRGAVAVESTPGEGTTFRVYLPELPAIKAKPKIEEDPKIEGRQPALHVAIIDDEDVVLQLTRQALEFSGFRTTTFTSPEVCLAALSQNPQAFHLIITDQRMPTITGGELLRTLRAQGSRIPVLVTSGSVASSTPQELAAAGHAQFLAKPFTLDSLLDAVRDLLERPDAG